MFSIREACLMAFLCGRLSSALLRIRTIDRIDILFSFIFSLINHDSFIGCPILMCNHNVQLVADRYALGFSRRLIHATIRTKMSHQGETSNSGSNLHSYPNSDEKMVTLLYYKDSRVKIWRAEAFRSPLSPFTDHLHLRMPPKKEAVQITSNQSYCRCRRHQAKCLRSVCKQRPTWRRPRQR